MPTFGGVVVATGKEATGRRTLQEIVDELSRPIDASDSTVRALAGDAFRAAVRTMNRKGLWPWEAQNEEVSQTSGNPLSSLASGNRVKKPLAMHYLTASGGTKQEKLGFTPWENFVEKYTLNITGKPHTYTIQNLFETGQVRWFPTPGASETCSFEFYRVTPAPRNESEAVEIPDMAIEVYMSYAWLEFLKRLPTEQRPTSINQARVDARLAFRELSAHVVTPGDRSREVNINSYYV